MADYGGDDVMDTTMICRYDSCKGTLTGKRLKLIAAQSLPFIEESLRTVV